MDSIQIINFLLDGFFLGFIIFMIVRNCIRGFLDSLATLVKIVVAPIFAVIFNLPLARFIANIFFDSAAIDWVNKLLLTTETTNEAGQILYDVDSVFDGIPNNITRFILRAGENGDTQWFIDEFFDKTDGNVPSLATADELSQLSEILGSRVALGISIIISFILIFVFVEVFILVFSKLINKLIEKATVAKVFNVVFGGIIGAVLGLLITWAICFILGNLFEFGQYYYPNFFLDEYWNKTLIVRFFIEHDLLDIVSKIAIH